MYDFTWLNEMVCLLKSYGAIGYTLKIRNGRYREKDFFNGIVL